MNTNIKNIIDRCKSMLTDKNTILRISRVYVFNHLLQHINGEYVSQKVVASLPNYKICYKYSLNCSNNNVINIFIVTKNRRIEKAFENTLSKYVYCAMNVIARKITNRTVNVLFVNSPYKKKLSKKHKFIGHENVNTGYAYTSKFVDVNIVIYRREEFFKTLIHELIHYFEYHPSDSMVSNYLVKSKYCALKGINNIHAMEAYTETMANYLNCLLISSLISKKGFEFNKLFDNEKKHSIDKIQLVLSHYSIESIEDFEKCDIEFFEKSHVFSYYIIKSALIHYDDYIKAYLHPFDQIDKLHFYNDMMIDALNSESWRNKCKINKKKTKNDNSMRMTTNDVENIQI